MLAAFGRSRVPVYARPRVAILATGDEIVPVHETPADFQIRNSNVYSLAAQVARAGGLAEILPVARDEHEHTSSLVERGLASDLLLISGGVSAGKYDLVEQVLAGARREFFFDRVLIQPGQPLVFGVARGKFFFGLPGNPSSTMVTFEIFARAAVELLGGQEEIALHMPYGAAHRRVPPQTGADAIPARASQRRRHRGNAGGLARIERRPRTRPRERVSGGRSRPRRISARRADPGVAAMTPQSTGNSGTSMQRRL